MNWQPGDYLAALIMAVTIGALIFGHVRSIILDRRAQRELDKRLGRSTGRDKS